MSLSFWGLAFGDCVELANKEWPMPRLSAAVRNYADPHSQRLWANGTRVVSPATSGAVTQKTAYPAWYAGLISNNPPGCPEDRRAAKFRGGIKNALAGLGCDASLIAGRRRWR